MKQTDVGQLFVRYILKDIEAIPSHDRPKEGFTRIFRGNLGVNFNDFDPMERLLKEYTDLGYVRFGGNDYPLSDFSRIVTLQSPWYIEVP